MKYLSLFTGIGGFEKGIEQAYENNKSWVIEQRYKQCGNAVTVNVIEDIMNRLI